MIDLQNIDKVHFIGIGGISMAGLALHLSKIGKIVSGSDINLFNSPLYNRLKKSPIKIYDKHDQKNIEDCQLVVYSGAIDKNNCELIEAKKRNIEVMERSEFLGLFSLLFKQVIAVAGCHGKTTTTSLISNIFFDAKLNPTIHIGGISRNLNTSFFSGDKNLFISEACEYKKSFLKLYPNISVITNIDADHLDCYKDIEDIKQSFKIFANQTKDYIIFNGDNIKKEIFDDIYVKKISFGFNKTNNYYIDGHNDNFTIYKDGKQFINSKTILYGDYNLLNILASVVVADLYGINKTTINKSIQTFLGVERRFEFIAHIGKSDLYKDYAHHPNEIKELLKVCKNLGYDKVIAIFQPHTYSRTKTLFNEFLNCFCDSDELVLVPTYSAREKIIEGGKSEDLFHAIKKIYHKTYFLSSKKDVQNYINQFKNRKCIIILIGAGDIDTYYK